MVSLLGTALSLAGALKGNKADKKKNKRADEELALQKRLADSQIDISKYIQDISRQLMERGSGTTDVYGGGTVYDPVTKTWKTTLGDTPKRLQSAADEEELSRLTQDQALRRQGLVDLERQRGRASGAADAALNDLMAFKGGVGKVDPATIASQLRASRLGAINAGFDDAERAATTLQTRTGSSAVADALRRIAVDRVRAQAQIGTPDVEGLEIAEGINRGRTSDLANIYSLFQKPATQVYDASFAPAPYAETAAARLADAQKLDLGRFETAMGGSGTAAAGVGSAAAGLRGAYTASEAGRVHAPTAKMLGAFANVADELGEKIVRMFAGGGGF